MIYLMLSVGFWLKRPVENRKFFYMFTNQTKSLNAPASASFKQTGLLCYRQSIAIETRTKIDKNG